MSLTACATSRQVADVEFRPPVSSPAFGAGEGPLVLIDEGHFNFHTSDRRYKPFAELLRRDGYRVEGTSARWSAESLEGAEILVVSNALAEENAKKWRLPTPSAFGDDEIAALLEWVAGGKSLFLIADHMPFPGAAEELAAELGVFFMNGYAMIESGSLLDFRLEDGTLAGHPITHGRQEDERIEAVRTFTGQAFRAVGDVEPLLILPAGSKVLLPSRAWRFSKKTPRMLAEGLLQGAVLRHGEGRVAVFGEAAMFSAQLTIRGEESRPMGMNHPDAAQNPQFLLNVVHWLSGLLGDD